MRHLTKDKYDLEFQGKASKHLSVVHSSLLVRVNYRLKTIADII